MYPHVTAQSEVGGAATVADRTGDTSARRRMDGHQPGEDGDFVVGADVLQSAELRRSRQRRDRWNARMNDKQPVTRVRVQG